MSPKPSQSAQLASPKPAFTKLTQTQTKIQIQAYSVLVSIVVIALAMAMASPVWADGQRGHIAISGSVPSATLQVPYSAALAVSGGSAPYSFSIISGQLPTGLALNQTTGAISGVPATAGNFNFTVAVSDPNANHGDKRLTLTVASMPPSGISVTVSPTSATVASGASQPFTASVRGTSQTAVNWSASAGKISSVGLFTAPTVSATTGVTVTATSVADSTKSASATVSVTPPGPPPSSNPSITTTVIPPATTGVAYAASLVASGGKPPYQWSVSGSLPKGIILNGTTGALGGTTSQQGQFTFTAKVTDTASNSATQSLTLSVSPTPTGSQFDGPAELPRVYIQSALANTPAPGTTIYVGAGGNLQTALNSANCGDTISLQAGASFAGSFTLPGKACDNQHWIIIRTSAPDTSLPPEGTRMTPCYAGVTSLLGRPFKCSGTQTLLPQIVYTGVAGDGPIVFAPGANYYRLLGLEITRQPGPAKIGTLISEKKGTADHIVIDRVWVHGTAQDETQNGVVLSDTTYVAVVDSFFTDLHCIAVTGACTDAKAIGGGNGSNPGGPYKIVNNFLEASGQGILFGGSAATTTPADIEIRRNHFFKPMQWKPGAPGFVGGVTGNPFIVKNHFELKNAQRVLFEGNILENVWGGFSQFGRSILLTPKNQHQGTTNVCPLCQVTDVTIRYSTISHVGGGLEISTGISGNGTNGGMALAGARFSFHDLTLDDISASQYIGHGTLVQVANSWTANVLNTVTINHITGFTDPNGHLVSLGNFLTDPMMSGFTFTNNIVVAARYPVWSTGGGASNCAYSNIPVTSLASCFQNYTFAENAIVGTPSPFPPSLWPSSNYFPAAATAVGFVNYNNGNGGDYHLLPSSPYKNAGSDGKDLGADINAIQTATAGVY